MNRECRCSCDSFALVIRVASFLAHCASGAAGGWGFILANRRAQNEGAIKSLGGGDIVANVAALNASTAVYQGLMAFYFCIFAFLGIFAELRSRWINGNILKYLGFLKTYMGRACFMIYVGALGQERGVEGGLGGAVGRALPCTPTAPSYHAHPSTHQVLCLC